MLDERSIKLDLVALVLLGFVIFFALSVVTYSPADPVGELVSPLNRLYTPDQLVYPQNEEVQNLCGRWGAFVADLSFQSLGLGTYYILISLALLDYLLLRRQEIDSAAIRFTGWLCSLIGFTILAHMVVPNATVGPVIGSGGYLGSMIGGMLQMEVALAGGLVLAFSLVVGGLLISTDYVLFEATAKVAGLAVNGSVGSLRFLRYGRDAVEADEEEQQADTTVDASNEESSEEEAEQEADENPEPSIRIRGQRLADDAEYEEDADADEMDEAAAELDEEVDEELDETEDEAVDEAEDEEIEDEEEEEAPVKKSPVSGPHFKIKKKEKKPDERLEVMAKLDAASDYDGDDDYELPDVNLLLESDEISFDEQAKEVRRKARILEKTFANFGFSVKVVEIETGPVIAQYEVELEAGLRLSRITGLADDLAIALRVPSVRIVAPIPGKNTVGIEVPNETRQVVRLREVIEESNDKVSKMRIPIFLGKDVSGNPMTVDLSSMPHLLIAGRTGTGKSVCLNAIISSILMTRTPDEVRMLMIDPKMVELSCYGRLPHLMHPVVTDMRKAEAILAWAVDKMEERYSLLARAGVRHISSYNQLSEEELMNRLQPETDEERESIPTSMPFIVIVADEMADLMMTAGKDVEQHIIRLAQKSRAVGIHLILATQKPTVDVITGLIKSNLPARLAFQVASRTDSRVVLDEMGADKLLGNGDMLFLWPGTSSLVRGQGTYLSDDEINMVVDSVSTHEQDFVHELVNLKVESEGEATDAEQIRKRDDLYESAIDVVVRERRGSVSLLQRSLGIGYGRAARLIDYMAEDKIVGEYAGSQAREVLISTEDWERMQAGETVDPATSTPPKSEPATPQRSNKILPDPDGEWDPDDGDDDKPPKKTPPKKLRKKSPGKATIPFNSSSSESAEQEDEPDLAEDGEAPLADEDEVARATADSPLEHDDVDEYSDEHDEVVAEEQDFDAVEDDDNDEDEYDEIVAESEAEDEEDDEEEEEGEEVEDEWDEEEADEEASVPVAEDEEEEELDDAIEDDGDEDEEEYEYEYVYEDVDEEEEDGEWDSQYEESA